MAQQINLCTANFRPVRQRFAARAMAQALAVFLLLGGTLAAAWAWSLEQSTISYRKSTAAQAKELASLKAAILKSRENARPVDPALLAQLQDRRVSVNQREALIEVVQQGMFKPGEGHSDRLLMVARSIPGPIWITGAKVDVAQFVVDGYTLDPSALNEWVKNLAAQPLMRNLRLTTVTVESKTAAQAMAPARGASAPRAALPMWSFNLTNMEPPPPVVASAPAAGVKP
jgi:Tfp pilus assembly protein PilN